jgi:hypothetical protein
MDNNPVLLSVGIPTFNGDAALEKTLRIDLPTLFMPNAIVRRVYTLAKPIQSKYRHSAAVRYKNAVRHANASTDA